MKRLSKEDKAIIKIVKSYSSIESIFNALIEKPKSIYDKKMENPKVKKLFEKELKKLQKEEEKAEKKLLTEGYIETAKIIKEEQMETRKVNGAEVAEVTSVDEMLDDLHSHRDWTILDYVIHYWHVCFWNYVSDIPLRVKTFIQRGIRGWADSDTWCFDYYLSKVIPEGVKHLIKYGNSCWTK